MKKSSLIIFGVLIVIVLVATVLLIKPKSSSVTGQGILSQADQDKIYDLDPQRKLIGTNVDDFHFKDVVSGKPYHFDDLKGKPIVIETFSVGCPACAAGIKKYNNLYDKYSGSIVIIYMDISDSDTEQDILNIKSKYDGRNWIWVKYEGSLLPFYEKFNVYTNEQTFIIGKDGKIEYADSFAVPIERIDKKLNEILQK